MKQKKNKLLILIAKSVSRIFGFGTFILLALVAVFSGQFNATDYGWIFLSAMMFILSGGVLFLFTKLRIFSDFDLSDRSERPLFFFILIILGIVLFFLYVIFDVSMILRYFILIYLVEIILDFMITLFWKISNHTLAVTSFISFSIILLGFGYLYLLLLLPFPCLVFLALYNFVRSN